MPDSDGCICSPSMYICARIRARAVRKVSVWPGHATFSRTHTHTHVPVRRGRYCVTVTTLSFYVTSRASNMQQKRQLFYMWEARINLHLYTRGHTCPHCVASKKEASHVISCIDPGATLKSGFAIGDHAKRPEDGPGVLWSISPSSDTRLSIGCRQKMRKCFGLAIE